MITRRLSMQSMTHDVSMFFSAGLVAVSYMLLLPDNSCFTVTLKVDHEPLSESEDAVNRNRRRELRIGS